LPVRQSLKLGGQDAIILAKPNEYGFVGRCFFLSLGSMKALGQAQNLCS